MLNILINCLKYLLIGAFQNLITFGMLKLHKGIIPYADILLSAFLSKLLELQK